MLESLMRQIADYYDSHIHEPEAIAVVESYAALKSELWQQYQLLTAFIEVYFEPVDAYDNAIELCRQIQNKRWFVVRNSVDSLHANHPLSEIAPNGETFNSIFRAVHDGFAHYPSRNDFTLEGEFKAFQSHARLLSPLAIHAVATETLGQQAAMRFGVASQSNSFAEQKALLLPLTLVNQAYHLDV